jgi:hypothetical protein
VEQKKLVEKNEKQNKNGIKYNQAEVLAKIEDGVKGSCFECKTTGSYHATFGGEVPSLSSRSTSC